MKNIAIIILVLICSQYLGGQSLYSIAYVSQLPDFPSERNVYVVNDYEDRHSLELVWEVESDGFPSQGINQIFQDSIQTDLQSKDSINYFGLMYSGKYPVNALQKIYQTIEKQELSKWIRPLHSQIFVFQSLYPLPTHLEKYSSFQQLIVLNKEGEELSSREYITDYIQPDSIFHQYQSAIQLSDQKKADINTLKWDLEMEMMGMKLEAKRLIIKSEFYADISYMNENPIRKKIFQDGVAINYSMRSGLDTLHGDKALDARLDSYIFKELYYKKYGCNMTYLGRRKVDSLECYKIQVTKPGGNFTFEYYDVNTGLKYKEVSFLERYDRPVPMQIYYLDYSLYAGVKFPNKIIIAGAGPQPMQLKTENILVNPSIDKGKYK